MDAPHHRGVPIVSEGLALSTAVGSAIVVAAIGLRLRLRFTKSVRAIRRLDKPAATTESCETTGRSASRAEPRFTSARPRTRRLCAGLACMIGVLAVGPFPVAILLVSGLAVARVMPILNQRRQRQEAERELPGTIELLVLNIHAGLTPNQAIREIACSAPAATRPAFVEVVHRMDRGEPLATALAALPDALGPRAVGVAEVTASAARYGVPISRVLDQLSSEARNTRRRLDEAAARKLPVRLSFPLVVCTLPSFVLLAIAPAVIAALSSLGTSAG